MGQWIGNGHDEATRTIKGVSRLALRSVSGRGCPPWSIVDWFPVETARGHAIQVWNFGSLAQARYAFTMAR